MPIQINADTGAIEPITEVNYKQITQQHFTEETAGQMNRNFRYTTKGAAKLATSLNNSQEVHFEVPLGHICRLAKCKQMFPVRKKYFFTLFKTKESVLLCSQDPGAHQNVIFQLTDCTIDVPIVESMPEKQETKRQKIASDEGICYSLMNSYIRSYYIYPIDTTIYNYNVMNGYRAKYIFIYWVDHTHESDGDININNFILERPNLRTLDIWSDDHLIKSYEAKKERQPSTGIKCTKTS